MVLDFSLQKLLIDRDGDIIELIHLLLFFVFLAIETEAHVKHDAAALHHPCITNKLPSFRRTRLKSCWLRKR
jgi:hypothetical protein